MHTQLSFAWNTDKQIANNSIYDLFRERRTSLKKPYVNTFFRTWQKIMTEQGSQKEN